MARIEDDRWIIETEEEAEAIAKLSIKGKHSTTL